MDAEQLIYVKTNIGGYFFDAFLRIDHTSRLSITSHPVQSGSNVADHAYMEPNELAMDIGMTDVATSIADGQFSEGSSRSVTAYSVLRELQEQRIPIQVVTRLKVYQNMLIETLTSSEDYLTQYSLKASVTMREVIVAEVTTVKLSTNNQVTDSTNRGSPQAVKANQSILTQISKLLTGN